MTKARAFRCRTRDDRWSFDIPDGSTVVVGRGPEWADVIIPFPGLARRDIRFCNQGGVLTVEAVERRGFFLLNGIAVSDPVKLPLCKGDEILLQSDLILVVEVADEPLGQSDVEYDRH